MEGDHLKMFDYDESVMIEVISRRVYDSFEEMLNVEDAGKIVPGYDKEGLSTLLHKFYPPEKEELGVVVFEVEIID